MSYLMQNKTKVSVNHREIPKSVEWDKATGAAINHATSRMRPAADKSKVIMSGDTTRDNITTEAFLDAVRDAGFITGLLAGKTYAGTTIVMQDIDNAGLPIGKARTFAGCQIEKVSFPDADANSEDAAKVVIEWAVP